MDWLSLYMQYTDGTPTPEIYRLWAGITAISGALERRVWAETGRGRIYPNLYTLLVGLPAVGKSKAIEPVKDLWKSTKDLHIAPDNITKAALVDILQKNSRWLIREDVENGAYEYHTTLVPVGEFGVFLSSYDLDFMSVLNHVYDCPSNYREERRSMEGRNPDITNPQLVILGGTQPDYLATVLPEQAWGMGFCSRLIMVYADKSPIIDLFGVGLDSGLSLKSELVSGLAQMRETYGQMKWSPAAKAAISLWYKDGMPPVPDHARLQHYNGRRILHAIKLATVSSMSRSRNMRIEEEDVEKAKVWLFEVERKMPDIFRAMLSRSDGEVIQELHFYLWRHWATVPPDRRTPVQEEILYNYLKHKVPSEKIAKIIEVAEKSGVIQHNAGGGWIPQPLEALRA